MIFTYLIVAHGFILKSEKFVELMKKAYPYFWGMDYANIILQLNPTCFVWYDSIRDAKYAEIISSSYKNEHQMILLKTSKNLVY